MRILHISTRLIVGGSQENTILSCRGHLEHGHDVHLAFGPIYGPEGSMLGEGTEGRRDGGTEEEGTKARGHEGTKWGDLQLHEIPDMVREIAPRRDIRAQKQLRRLIRDIEPDVVHTHSSKAGILGRMAGWAEGGMDGKRAVFHTIHGSPFHRYLPAWRNKIYIEAERFAAKRCHKIISVADAMTSHYLAQKIGRPEQYITIHSGMETEAYLDAPSEGPDSRAGVRAELGFAESDIVIGTVARLAELKGHDDLIEALAEDLRSNKDWKLLWVGDGWKRKKLESKLEARGIQDRVVMTGLVPPDQVPRMIRAMDLVVHPSYREGLPRVVPQALLSSVPIVACDVDGTGEACIEMETGRLVAPGDLAGLRQAIEWTIENRNGAAKQLAEAGRGRCRERFDWKRMVERVEDLYRQSLNGLRK